MGFEISSHVFRFEHHNYFIFLGLSLSKTCLLDFCNQYKYCLYSELHWNLGMKQRKRLTCVMHWTYQFSAWHPLIYFIFVFPLRDNLIAIPLGVRYFMYRKYHRRFTDKQNSSSNDKECILCNLAQHVNKL